MKFNLASSYTVDSADYGAEGIRIAILAQSGHGKSYLAARLIEDALEQKAQAIILEPIAEWYTLKAKYSNVVVVGGEYGDLPLEPDFAGEYVKAALGKGLTLVVNVSDLESAWEQRKFAADFLWNLYRLEQKHRRVVFLVLEEADFWAPQMWDRESKPSLSRIALIAKHGRKIGIFPILISQRPSDLHKSPLSQCNLIFFGKFTSPADLDPRQGVMWLAKKLHIPISEKDVASLQVAEWVAWDKFGVHRFKAGRRLCPHGADTPLIKPVEFTLEASTTLTDLRKSIEQVLAEKRKEKSMVEKLQSENERLKTQLAELQRRLEIREAVADVLGGAKAGSQAGLEMKLETLE
ncbi:TPA: DUF87 domain-containing protein, partial [Candidatus Bathyarchaeota archaeon]|nr:DUF87 domain-containing protein [Candidatus Bathyarchaeota archaeon]